MRRLLRPLQALRLAMLMALPALLGGCNLIVLSPAGDVAQRQGNLVMISTVLMLLIIVPVMALTVFFAWRYRAANTASRYDPDWDHSTGLELVIWAAPLVIIICLGALTWAGTHLLDPFRPLDRTAPGTPVAEDIRPLEVNVVAMDWKWLFIMPEYGIATVNELAAPVDRPIRFRISATSVMNSFYIPALAGQIYAMPGMETKLHAVINHVGEYQGFSANYSGAGFSGMRFRFHGLSEPDFAAWVGQVRLSEGAMDRATFLALERPSENVPPRRYSSVDPTLFDAIVNMCVEPGKMCMHDMMAIDARGGLGVAGIGQVQQRLAYDRHGARGRMPLPDRSFVTSICTIPVPSPERPFAAPVSSAPLTGAGLAPPGPARSTPVAGHDAVPLPRS
ncbi:ubiquinol oxidase subunit II [Roseococcus sp. YIM B11640]|uniref:ubiquinol oxidase subunit II n=1 Tax=Roseococcus sp. YIM B11640 TaxID=3133973 RepID=UPI003C7A7257